MLSSGIKKSGDGRLLDTIIRKTIILTAGVLLLFVMIMLDVTDTASAKDPVWSVSTDKTIHTVDISGDGQYLVNGGADGNLTLYQQNSSTPIWKWDAGTRVVEVVISYDGWWIAAASNDSRVVYFNRTSSNPLWVYEGSNSMISLSISRNGSHIAAGGSDRNVTLFGGGSSTPLWNYRTDQYVDRVAISENGSYLVAGSRDNSVYFFNTSNSTPLWTHDTGSMITSVDITSSGYYCVATSSNGRLYYFRMNHTTGSEPEWQKWINDLVEAVISDDGTYIGVMSYNDVVNMYHRDSSLLRSWSVDTTFGRICISADGDKMLVLSGKDHLFLFDKDAPEPLWDYYFPALEGETAISSDGLWITAGGSNNRFALFTNDPPVAVIHTISREAALQGQLVRFKGDPEDDDSNLTHVWSSNLTGEFYNGTDEELEYSTLLLGNHTISYRVRDSYGVWSDPVEAFLTIHQKPVAVIVSIEPEVVNLGENITFTGGGTDDGEITSYSWSSSLGDDLYYGHDNEFTRNDLSDGNHTISLLVQDDHGVWSDEETAEVRVNSPPNCWITWQSHDYAVFGDVITFDGSSWDTSSGGSVTGILWLVENESGIEMYRNDSQSLVIDPAEILDLEEWLEPGNFTVLLSVMDNDGAWSIERNTTFIIHLPPQAEIGIEGGEIFSSSSLISFPGYGYDEEPIAAGMGFWRFTDNETGEEWERYGKQVNIYLPTGNYTINYKVRDNHGVNSTNASSWFRVRDPPTVKILEINPSPALNTSTIVMTAEGDPMNVGGKIVLYEWSSSIDGEFGNYTIGEFIVNGNLTPGYHTISVRVWNDAGLASVEYTRELEIHTQPIGVILSIHPNPIRQTDIATFSAHGMDDGSVEHYQWHSSIDRYIANGTNYITEISGLTPGNHTISLTVQDDNGEWSEPVISWLVVEMWVPEYDGPKIEINSPEYMDEVSGMVNITGTCSDDISDIVRVELSFDSLQWVEADGLKWNETAGQYDWWYLWNSSEFLEEEIVLLWITAKARSEQGFSTTTANKVAIPGEDEGGDGRNISLSDARWDIGIIVGILVIMFIGIAYFGCIYNWESVYKKHPWVKTTFSMLDWVGKHPMTVVKLLAVIFLLGMSIAVISLSWLYVLYLIIVGIGITLIFWYSSTRKKKKK